MLDLYDFLQNAGWTERSIVLAEITLLGLVIGFILAVSIFMVFINRLNIEKTRKRKKN